MIGRRRCPWGAFKTHWYILIMLHGSVQLCVCPGKTWESPSILPLADFGTYTSSKWRLTQSCNLLAWESSMPPTLTRPLGARIKSILVRGI
jgi:hypothetical protein